MRFLVAVSVYLTALGSIQSADRDLLIFAAASQRDALLQIGEKFESQCDCKVNFSFAASSALARQIAAGAPADLVISANRDWIDWLKERKHIADEAHVIARNRLVVVSSNPGFEGLDLLREKRFAMGNPIGVPAGIYAKQALESQGLWNAVQKNAVFTENVRVSLALVSRKDLELGIVYASDLHVMPSLHKSFVFNDSDHAPIEYLIARVGTEVESSSGFLSFIKSAEAQKIFKSYGFIGIDHE